MSAWKPTPAQQRQFADYSVTTRTADHPQKTYVIDGVVHRGLFHVQRIPSQRVFLVSFPANLTPRERRMAEAEAVRLPYGYWAEFRDVWYRKRWPSGRYYFAQTRCYAAPDPFAQVELEMLIDLEQASTDTEVTA